MDSEIRSCNLCTIKRALKIHKIETQFSVFGDSFVNR